MARPKSDISKSYVGLRVDNEIISEVDKLAEKKGMSRSQIVVDAITSYLDFYIHSKECLLCGAVNPGEGKKCAVCGSRLFNDEDIEYIMANLMFEYSANNIHLKNLIECNYEGSSELLLKYLKSYSPLLKFKIDRTEGNTNYVVSLSFYDKDGLVFTPSGVNCDFCLNRENLYKCLCSWWDEHKEEHKTE